MCFRLHFAKDATIGNTAGATVRQLVSLVFERVVIEDASSNDDSTSASKDFIKLPDSPQSSLNPLAQDAFSLFQVGILFLIFILYVSLSFVFIEHLFYINVTGPCIVGKWRSTVLADRHDRNDQDVWD